MKYIALPLILLVTACSTSGPARDYMPYLGKKGVTGISPENIPHCHGYGCRLKSYASLDNSDWAAIARVFKKVDGPVTERMAIAKAVGLFEKKVGQRTGTDTDVAGTYDQLGDDQHDCTDESVNTTVYLDLLSRKKWLRFHDISTISSRIPIFGGGLGFHQTAVIVERSSGQRYAVDSWFHDNGHDAEIVPLPDWLYGWRPRS